MLGRSSGGSRVDPDRFLAAKTRCPGLRLCPGSLMSRPVHLLVRSQALMSNPSHFDVFSLAAFRNRAVVVTGVARAGKTNVPDAAPQHAGRREDVAWLQEASAQ